MSGCGSVFLKKTFVAVTGASRGLGKCIAFQFASKLPLSSVMVLMARDVDALEKVKSDLIISSPHVIVIVKQYDQGRLDNNDYFNDIFDCVMKENNLLKDSFEQYMVVHNCATPGDVTKTALQMSDSNSIRTYYDVNLIGMILLNTSFFKTFSDSTKSRVIVNMSSGGSRNPKPSLNQYCSGKAARDMFFRVLAVEDPSIRVLTFTPRRCDTEMLRYYEKYSCSDSGVRLHQDLRRDNKIPSADDAVKVLVEVLEKNDFKNGVLENSV